MTGRAQEHLRMELQRLDLLLQREILRLRTTYQLSLDEFRGLYISDEQVDALIRRQTAAEGAFSPEELTGRAAALRNEIDAHFGGDLPLPRLAREFALTPAQTDFLLIALAPDFDLKYETLYAYLNNDVTRKWPTVDLALRLTSRAEPLLPDSALFENGLLQSAAPAPDRSAWLAAALRPAPPVAPFVLGRPILDPRLAECCRVEEHPAGWDETPVSPQLLAELRPAGKLIARGDPPVLVFVGRAGSGREKAAGAVCASQGRPLLTVDLESAGAGFPAGSTVALQARLARSGIYLRHAELLFDREGNALAESRRLLKSIAASGCPVFLGIAPGLDWHALLQGTPALPFAFAQTDFETRLRLWKENLARRGISARADDLAELAGRFALSPGQIGEAAELAAARNEFREDIQAPAESAALFRAARESSSQSLGRLAVKLEPAHDWSDLVLPAATLRRAREAAAAIRNCSVVYEEWDFRRRITSGRGLKILFSGSSGTGKTMTAGIIAKELGLDIYRIDLSGIVSKYIGETEKNLDRIFHAAESGNAILFFDEADALFGKRSEVKDAHDRYANIEISYLLQKIEEYPGVVILASNLSQNIDSAFARRMHYVIDFPMPDAAHREQLWRGMIPACAPLGEDVDFRFLAGQFPLSGGEIRNVSLEAAFLAAQDGRVIRMHHLVQAMARQVLKQGGLPSAADFKQFYALIGRE
jgi:SpoVK/Ycf46/Vps4 family AAA+-type ATPase